MAGVIQACDGMHLRVGRFWGHWHNGSLNVTGFFFTCVQVLVCKPEKKRILGPPQEEEIVCVGPKLDPIVTLLNSGPHMRSISICRNCETFTTMNCDRFHKLSFSVARGGSQYSPSVDCECTNTSIRSWLSAVINSPLTKLGYAKV